LHGFQFNDLNMVKQYDAPSVGLTSHADTYAYNGDRQLTELILNFYGQGGNDSTISPSYDDYGRLDDVTLDAYNDTSWTLDYAYVQSGSDLGKLESVTESKDNVAVRMMGSSCRRSPGTVSRAVPRASPTATTTPCASRARR
jgi:hypothetical protein